MNWGSLLGLVSPIVLWLMKRAAVKEEAQQLFLASVKAVQARPGEATAAADEEAAALARLKAKLEAEQSGR